MALADEIRKLDELRQSGALTDEEYAKAKTRLLDGSPMPAGAPPVQTAPPYGGGPTGSYVDASKKIPAGICAILLGSLGIHKFVLGYTNAGIIMLAVSLLTCGIGGIVMHVIGIIEGIMYLTKSDEEFFETYVARKKEWF